MYFSFVLRCPPASARRSEDILTPQGTLLTSHGLLFSRKWMPWIPLRIDQGRTPFFAPDVHNSESRCTPFVFSDGTNKNITQTPASTMVSIARENICDNSNINLRILVIKPLWTHRIWISAAELEDPRFHQATWISLTGFVLWALYPSRCWTAGPHPKRSVSSYSRAQRTSPFSRGHFAVLLAGDTPRSNLDTVNKLPSHDSAASPRILHFLVSWSASTSVHLRSL